MLLLCAIVAFMTYLLLMSRKSANHPPGPAKVPVFGSVILLKKLLWNDRSITSSLLQLSSVYKSTLVGLSLGSQKLVIAFGQSAIDILLNRDCEGRPDDFFMRLRSMGTRKGITGVDGPLWEEHRRFILKNLRNFGYGKSVMERRIAEVTSDLVADFKKNGKNVQISSRISMSVMNILWCFVAGPSVENRDERIKILLKLLEKRSRVFDISGGLLNQLPWIRFVAPEKSGYSLIKQVNKEMHKFLSDIINDHKRNDTTEVAKEEEEDIISAYLKEMKSSKDESLYNEEQLMMMCMDLFIAGSHTTSSFLNVAIFALLYHPEVQIKVHKEIDQVIGTKKITYEDSKVLPYTMAAINEIQRYYSFFPLGGPRRAMTDVKIAGYVIPKNTTIFCSIQSLHMDQEIWGDPKIFRPERFLDEAGSLINTHKNMTFGFGRRRCLADTFAKHFIFIFLSNMFQHFSFTPSSGCVLSGDSMDGIFMQPKPYLVDLCPK